MTNLEKSGTDFLSPGSACCGATRSLGLGPPGVARPSGPCGRKAVGSRIRDIGTGQALVVQDGRRDRLHVVGLPPSPAATADRSADNPALRAGPPFDNIHRRRELQRGAVRPSPKNKKRMTSNSKEARRCLTTAQLRARTSYDWSCAASAWNDVRDMDAVRRCVLEAEKSARTMADWYHCARAWTEVVGDESQASRCKTRAEAEGGTIRAEVDHVSRTATKDKSWHCLSLWFIVYAPGFIVSGLARHYSSFVLWGGVFTLLGFAVWLWIGCRVWHGDAGYLRQYGGSMSFRMWIMLSILAIVLAWMKAFDAGSVAG